MISLDYFIEKLEKLCCGEEDHISADKILIDVIKELTRDTVNEEKAKTLCDAYNKIGKWYA